MTFGPTDDERRANRRRAFVAGLTDLSRRLQIHVELDADGLEELMLHDELDPVGIGRLGWIEWDHARGIYAWRADDFKPETR